MMPDYIKITHQPKTMATPTISASLDTFEQAANRGTCVYLSPKLVQELRAALKAEPRGQRPSEKDLYDLAAEFNGDPVPAMRRALELWGNPLQGAPAPGEKLAAMPMPQPEGDWFTVATIAQDMRSRGLAEQMAGDRLLELANGNRSQPVRPALQAEPVGERLPGDVATDDEIQEKFRQSLGTIAEGWRGIYNMGYKHGAATFPEPKSENIVLLTGGIEEIADFLFEMEKYDWYATLNRASKHLQRLNRAAQSAQVPAPQAGEVEA
jgi:hypothetical protein